jgi:hypothetical protein
MLSVRDEFFCTAAQMSTWSLGSAREALAERMRQARADGLKTYKLFPSHVLQDEEAERHLVEMVDAGAQVRVCPSPLRWRWCAAYRRRAGRRVTGWLGGELVERLGIGVDDNVGPNTPSSLSRTSTSPRPRPPTPGAP